MTTVPQRSYIKHHMTMEERVKLARQLMEIAAEASELDCPAVEHGCLALIRSLALTDIQQKFIAHLFTDLSMLLHEEKGCHEPFTVAKLVSGSGHCGV